MTKAIYIFLAIAVLAGLASLFINKNEKQINQINDEQVACTMDAMQCPDGSFVGRTGPNCEFVCPELPSIDDDVQAHIDSKVDLIKVASPRPNVTINSPLVVNGEARGYWFFEGSFPIILTDWDGKIIAESFATAQSDWMTEDFVAFVGELNFVSSYNDGDPDFMKKGTLIFKKDNPSDLPEHDDALEIPVRFAN
ncbi:MAG: Gmad2 immunoglobulin-like domain-containing protein [Candidatus Paceibacterota bacterium]